MKLSNDVAAPGCTPMTRVDQMIPNFSTRDYISERHHPVCLEHRVTFRKLLIFFLVKFLFCKIKTVTNPISRSSQRSQLQMLLNLQWGYVLVNPL